MSSFIHSLLELSVRRLRTNLMAVSYLARQTHFLLLLLVHNVPQRPHSTNGRMKQGLIDTITKVNGAKPLNDVRY